MTRPEPPIVIMPRLAKARERAERHVVEERVRERTVLARRHARVQRADRTEPDACVSGRVELETQLDGGLERRRDERRDP